MKDYLSAPVELIDTHCHIHFSDYELDREKAITAADRAGVTRLVAVGCTLPDSKLAADFAKQNDKVWASVGLHPHEAARYTCDEPICLTAQRRLASPALMAQRSTGHLNLSTSLPHSRHNPVCVSSCIGAASQHRHNDLIREFIDLVKQPKVIAIGETGLDYHYMHSSKKDQIKLFRLQLDMAAEHDLPLIFHVRRAFSDFCRIVDEYQGLKGVVHSFSSDERDLNEILGRGFYVGLNGIMTFTKNKDQLAAAKKIPLVKLLLETDAPFLTPVPFRGSICQPKHVRDVAEFLADLRGESLEELAAATTANAEELFKIR